MKVLQTRLEVAQQQVAGRNAPEQVPQDVLEEENIMLKAQVQELLDRNARLEVSNIPTFIMVASNVSVIDLPYPLTTDFHT